MPQLSLKIDLDGLDAEVVESVVFAAGALSVTYSDQRDDPILEPAPGEFRLWPATRLEALFAAEAAAPELLANLAGELGLPLNRLQTSTVGERVWEREWLRDFKPMRFGNRLWICPSHAQVDVEGAVVVNLDPGLAFGTGTHPTTRLCLEWLDACLRAGDTAIDYGCGSGILAIAALKLGANHVWAHDIDPQALLATGLNAATNNVADRLTRVENGASVSAVVDVVMANILSGPLCELAPRLTSRLRPAGQIVLAGLLEDQVGDVIDAYRGSVDLTRWRTLDGWVALAGRRLAGPTGSQST